MTGTSNVEIERVRGATFSMADDTVPVEEPMELQLEYGPRGQRTRRSIAVVMRTPGYDEDLAAGFLWTEGVIEESDAIENIFSKEDASPISEDDDDTPSVLPNDVRRNVVLVQLYENAQVRIANIERNFYTTSSCGVCGKASMSALRVLSPPRTFDEFRMKSSDLASLPQRLRDTQPLFARTGGLHGAALVQANGDLAITREDVGRHNAVDKLVGHSMKSDELPLRNHCLLLSGRVSFELMQKAVMAGIPFVAAVGAPSSLAVSVAKEFGTTLVGFLRDGGFNVYSGFVRLSDRTLG